MNLLRARGHEVVAASPSHGVNSITGEGLTEALTEAQVVVDVTNSLSWEDKAVLEFFETPTRNVLAAEAKTGAGHHVALSIVGSERLPASGYLRAKVTIAVKQTVRSALRCSKPSDAINAPTACGLLAISTATP